MQTTNPTKRKSLRPHLPRRRFTSLCRLLGVVCIHKLLRYTNIHDVLACPTTRVSRLYGPRRRFTSPSRLPGVIYTHQYSSMHRHTPQVHHAEKTYSLCHLHKSWFCFATSLQTTLRPTKGLIRAQRHRHLAP